MISIHAPRVGSDVACTVPLKRRRRFQSTLPVWGATCHRCFSFYRSPYFNPRSPCGERPPRTLRGALPNVISIHAPRVGSDVVFGDNCCASWIFQSTLPVWGATDAAHLQPHVWLISIHAPRVGSDRNIFYYSEPKTISCELRSQHDQLSGHLRIENTRLFSQNRCEPATFP